MSHSSLVYVILCVYKCLKTGHGLINQDFDFFFVLPEQSIILAPRPT